MWYDKKADSRKWILEHLFAIWASGREPKQPSPNPYPHVTSQYSD